MSQISEIFDSVNLEELEEIKKNIENVTGAAHAGFKMIAFIQID